MEMLKRHSRHILLSACVVAGSLVTGSLGAHHASAHLGVCYGDPAVLLSNGRALDLSVVVGDVSSDVNSVQYTLHAPAGTSVTGVYKTPGALGAIESFRFVADNSSGVYDTTTTVTTGSEAVSATAWSALVNLKTLSFLGSQHVTGVNRQVIASELVDPNP
jgi:hypothetical protein